MRLLTVDLGEGANHLDNAARVICFPTGGWSSNLALCYEGTPQEQRGRSDPVKSTSSIYLVHTKQVLYVRKSGRVVVDSSDPKRAEQKDQYQ